MYLTINKTREKREEILDNYVSPWLFEKSFEHIIVHTTLLEPNGPVTISFFFQEVFDVDFLLYYESFKQLSIVDATLLLTTMTDTITDPLFELIRARLEATEANMTASKSQDVSNSSRFRENDNDKEVSSVHKDNKRAKTSEDDKTEDAGSQQMQKASCFGSNAGRVCKESLSSQKTTEFEGNKIATRRSRVLVIGCCCFFLNSPRKQQACPDLP